MTDFTVDDTAYDENATYAVSEEKVVRFKAVANAHFQLNYVLLNDEKLVAGEDGTFTCKISDYSVITVVFSAKKYTITYVLNNGEDDEVVEYVYGEEKQLDDYFTKTGYTFDGWYLNEDLSGEKVTSIDTANPANITLYAKWTETQPDTDSETSSGSQTVKPSKGCNSSIGGGSIFVLGIIAAATAVLRKKRED